MGVPTSGTTSLHARLNEEKFMGAQMPEIAPEPAGEVAGSKPRKLQWDNGEPPFSLMREDIAGTIPQRWIGSVPANIYDPPEVRPMISFHDPHDIPGAQVGSLKKGIEGITRRQCNPLNPRYPMLDGEARPHPMLQSRMLSSTSAPDLRKATPQNHGQTQMQRSSSNANMSASRTYQVGDTIRFDESAVNPQMMSHRSGAAPEEAMGHY